MTDNGALNLLGLARRGGNLALGEESVAEACQLGKAKVVMAAADAGDTTARRGARAAEAAEVPLVTLPYGKAEVGFRLGRSSCALLAVTDRGLAAAVLAKLALEDDSLVPLAEALREKMERRRGGRPQQREKKHSPRTDDPSVQR